MIMSAGNEKELSEIEKRARKLAEMLATGAVTTQYEFNIKGHKRRYFEALKDGEICRCLNGLAGHNIAWRFSSLLMETFELMDITGAQKLTITCKLE